MTVENDEMASQFEIIGRARGWVQYPERVYLEVLGGDERDDYPIRDQVVAVTDNQALTLWLIGAINAYLEQTPYPRYP